MASLRQQEARVLAVIPADQWIWQKDVRTAARMDLSLCIAALAGLEADGVIERSYLLRGKGQGSGRPRLIYRRTRQQVVQKERAA